MNTDHINNRIQELTAEMKILEQTHNALVEAHQKRTQEFQQQAVQNQARFAQIQGALTELQNLKQPIGDNNHDDSIPTSDRSDRTLNVRAGR
jgi:hypothetical protein